LPIDGEQVDRFPKEFVDLLVIQTEEDGIEEFLFLNEFLEFLNSDNVGMFFFATVDNGDRGRFKLEWEGVQ
jgi:hypothetical protein